MAGPYPQYTSAALSQPNYSQPYPSYPYPAAPTGYQEMLPPPVPYPTRRRWRLVAAILLVVAVVAAATTAIVYATTTESGTSVSGHLSEATAKSAIQNYLDAMLKGNTEVVARNTSCGFYDSVKDKRSDQALARLASETFRKQFSKADVTSIDKMVFISDNQAQVLFSLQVSPVTRGGKNHEEQGVAQLLLQDDQVLVCSYLPRSAGQY